VPQAPALRGPPALPGHRHRRVPGAGRSAAPGQAARPLRVASPVRGEGTAIWVVSALTGRLTVDGFLVAVAAAVVISVLSTVLALVADRILLRGRDRAAAA
jgi:hypothetical protein